MTEEEVKLNYLTPAIENAGWQKKQIKMENALNTKILTALIQSNILKKKNTLIFINL